MADAIKDNLLGLEFHPKQEYFWRHANEIFDWCRVRFRAVAENLDPEARKEFAVGEIPQVLLNAAKREISERLLMHLDFIDHHEAVKAALFKPAEFEKTMDWPIHLHEKLPKRLRDRVVKAAEKKRMELHDEFFSEITDQSLTEYLQAWRSQHEAKLILISLARGEVKFLELEKKDQSKGGIRFGRLRLNESTWVLRHVETTGSLLGRGVAHAIVKLANENDVPFFIKLGKALKKASKSKRKRDEVEWDSVNEVARFIVPNWCNWPGNSERILPPLCLFSNNALEVFCSLALGKDENDPELSPNAVRKLLSRLGLKRVSQPKVREVQKPPKLIRFRM